MTKKEFNKYWSTNFSDAIPISYLFKNVYADRWFRIHSLPESKRYAENANEWTLLLNRQNEIINDLFDKNSTIILVTGQYNLGEHQSFITDEEEVFKPYYFEYLDNINLDNLTTDSYKDEGFYSPAFAETVWISNKHNDILREIANDNIKAFFVSFDKGLIVAPYDGGVDFILKDKLTRDFYKDKYHEWLSSREDGR